MTWHPGAGVKLETLCVRSSHRSLFGAPTSPCFEVSSLQFRASSAMHRLPDKRTARGLREASLVTRMTPERYRLRIVVGPRVEQISAPST